MTIQRRKDGKLTVVTGRSRSGKTASVIQQVASSRRLIVWDPQGDWVKLKLQQVASFVDLAKIATGDGKAGPVRISFKCPIDQANFGKFCRLVYSWGIITPLDIVVEELAWVTSPQRAPAGWLELVSGGLKYGINIWAITQRPAESDKTIMGNATVLRCFRMQRADDRRYMSKELDVAYEKVNALKPLQYIETLPDGSGHIEKTLRF